MLGRKYELELLLVGKLAELYMMSLLNGFFGWNRLNSLQLCFNSCYVDVDSAPGLSSKRS